MCFCLQWRAKVPPQEKSIRLQTSKKKKIIYGRRSLSNHVSRRSCNLSSCFMEIKCQNWITGFHQSLSSDLALGLLTFMQSWRQTVFGDWCKIAPGAGAAANQRRCKIAGILIRSSCVVPCWHCAGWEGWGWGGWGMGGCVGSWAGGVTVGKTTEFRIGANRRVRWHRSGANRAGIAAGKGVTKKIWRNLKNGKSCSCLWLVF